MALNLKFYILDPASRFGKVDSTLDLITFARKRNVRDEFDNKRIRTSINTYVEKRLETDASAYAEYDVPDNQCHKTSSNKPIETISSTMNTDTRSGYVVPKNCPTQKPSNSTEIKPNSISDVDPEAESIISEDSPTNDVGKCASNCDENQKNEYKESISPLFKRLDWREVEVSEEKLGETSKPRSKATVKILANDDDIMILDICKSVKVRESSDSIIDNVENVENYVNDVNGEEFNDVLNDTGESSSSGSGHSKRYTKTFKAEVCKFMLKHSAQEAKKKYGISWSTAKRWKKAYNASESSRIVSQIIDDVILDICH